MDVWHHKMVRLVLNSPLCPFVAISRLGVAAIIAIAASGHALSAQNSDFQTGLNRALPVSDPAFHPESAPALSAAAADSAPSVTGNLPEEPKPVGSIPSSAGAPAYDPDSLSDTQKSQIASTRLAPAYHRYIEPGQVARTLTPTQQVIFGLAQPVSPYFLLTIAAAAGYEQAVNGAPNYGSNIRAYGQRVGAAAARNASQSFFSYSVMAPLLHEDARYYIMGNRRNAFIRATYAASRAFVTRDADDGHATPNYAEISGYAEAAALTNAYYPPANRTFGRTVSSFGVSLVGLAVSNVVREFLPDILRVSHLEKFE
jgi:hypothetical protein